MTALSDWCMKILGSGGSIRTTQHLPPVHHSADLAGALHKIHAIKRALIIKKAVVVGIVCIAPIAGITLLPLETGPNPASPVYIVPGSPQGVGGPALDTPEPASLAVFGVGAAALFYWVKR